MSFTTSEIKCHIIDSVRRSALSILFLDILQLLSEDVVVGFVADLVHNNLFHIVGDFVNYEFRAILAQFQIIVCRDAVRVDRESVKRQFLEGRTIDMWSRLVQ